MNYEVGTKMAFVVHRCCWFMVRSVFGFSIKYIHSSS